MRLKDKSDYSNNWFNKFIYTSMDFIGEIQTDSMYGYSYFDEKEFLTNNLNVINQILIKLKEEYKYNPNKGTKMNLTVMENQKRNIVLKLWLLKDKNVKENHINEILKRK